MPDRARGRARRSFCASRGLGPALLAAAVACTGACTGAGRDALARLVPPRTDRVAREVIAAAARGDTAAVRRRLLIGARAPAGLGDSLFAVRAAFASDAPDTVRLVGAQVLWTRRVGADPVRYTDALYEVHTPPAVGATSGRWTAVRVGLAEELGVVLVNGLRAEPTPDALERVNAFTAPGKGAGDWLVVAAALGVAAYSLAACVRVARTPMPRRWGWALLALVGAGRLVLNWTTGEWGVQPAYAQLLGAGAVRSGLAGPWLVSVSLPLGAWLALRRRRAALAPSSARAGVSASDA